jgi:hypothetical protein
VAGHVRACVQYIDGAGSKRYCSGAMQVWLKVLAGAQAGASWRAAGGYLRAAVLAAAVLVQRGDAGLVGSAGRCAGRSLLAGRLAGRLGLHCEFYPHYPRCPRCLCCPRCCVHACPRSGKDK